MQVVYERCCGLDVHKETVAACIAITEAGRVQRNKRVFGTTTKQLLELSDWLAEHAVTHIRNGIQPSLLEADLEHSERAV